MSNRYNYFDDEDEIKPSNHKIDLSQVLNKIKSIEENVHDEAEDDIEVLEKISAFKAKSNKNCFYSRCSFNCGYYGSFIFRFTSYKGKKS